MRDLTTPQDRAETAPAVLDLRPGYRTLPHVAASREARRAFDALEPLTDDALVTAADDLVGHLRGLSPEVRVAQRLVGQP